jgi:hypothetical protein
MANSIYGIYEQGYAFMYVEAASGEEALARAVATRPPKSCDYNGYVGPVTWSAFAANQDYPESTLEVEVTPC